MSTPDPDRPGRPSIDPRLHQRINAAKAAKQATVGQVRTVTISEILQDWADWYDATADMRALGLSGTALLALMAQTGDPE